MRGSLPPVPQNVQYYTSPGNILVLWDKAESEDVVGYNVYVSREQDEEWTLMTPTPQMSTSFKHKGLSEGDVWQYYITSVNKAGRESDGLPGGDPLSLQDVLDYVMKSAPTSATIGIYCYHFGLKEEAGINMGERFPAMSCIKTALATALLENDRLKPGLLEKKVKIEKKNMVTGSGRLRYGKAGVELSYLDLLGLMLRDSDNIAANTVIDGLGGVKKINATLAGMDLKGLMILKKVFLNSEMPYPELSKKYELGFVVPQELGKLYRRLDAGKLVDKKHDVIFMDLLTTKSRGSRLKLFLSDLDNVTRIANKTGSSNHSRIDSGLVYTKDRGAWVLVIALKDYPNVSWEWPHPLNGFIADVSWVVHEYFGQRHGVESSVEEEVAAKP